MFDREMGIKLDEDWSAVRVVKIGEEDKLFEVGKALMDKGYYTSTVTFPTVSRSDSGLRIMIRTNMYDDEILDYANLIKAYKSM